MKLTNKQQALIIILLGTYIPILLNNFGVISTAQQSLLIYAAWGSGGYYGGGDVLFDLAGRIFGDKLPNMLDSMTDAALHVESTAPQGETPDTELNPPNPPTVG